MIIQLALFLLFSFQFHFILLLVLFALFKFSLIYWCICCFICCLCYCIYYHFMSLFIPHNTQSQKCGEKTNNLILFSLWIWRHVLIFFRLLYFLLNRCFNSNCYLYLIIYGRVQNIFGTLKWCYFWPILLRVALKLERK